MLAKHTDLSTLQYQVTISIPGRTYSFKVTAVNAVGEGTQSDPIGIIAAKVPDAPTNLTKVTASGS